MNVFDFRDKVVGEYESFSRSFSRFRAEDIKSFIEKTYASQRFTPPPLIQLNPFFVPGRRIDQLVQQGVLDPECATIFKARKKEDPPGITLALHVHQDEAIQKAQQGDSYVLTTGTGSGKSLSYFIPIVDAVLKEKKSGQSTTGRIRAIVIYPMNALCNSQLEELQKFLIDGYPKGLEPVTFGRYTGQESQEERHALAANPPDIILTNFMMLELLMTRQNDLDKTVVKAANGLRFLVLDELHTYRGRQGSDVALLIRRVRQAFNPDLLCIGTSATMSTEGDAYERKKKVAEVSSRLFGSTVKPESIITETLQRVTPEDVIYDQPALQKALQSGVPKTPTFDQLRQHPIAAWIEMNLGLTTEADRLIRACPRNINQAAELLRVESSMDLEICRDYLRQFLLLAYNTRSNGRSLFAFRLHQFISGPGDLFTTLEKADERYITVDGQQYKPGDRNRPLFNVVFCRECGQEYYPVWGEFDGNRVHTITPRGINEKSHEDENTKYGFFAPDPGGMWDKEDFEGGYPEDWVELAAKGPRIKQNYRKYIPKQATLNTAGTEDEQGLDGWYLPGSFRFCLNPDCRVSYDGFTRSDITKLSNLSLEGRSSATTVLTLSSLRYLLTEDCGLKDEAKKMLGFSDNRQDAALQAGHFNDFIQIVLLRSAVLNAVRKAPHGYLTDKDITQAVFDCLRLEPGDFLAGDKPETIPSFVRKNAESSLRDILGYRVYFDLRRGWRLNNPNLEQLGLMRIGYDSLKEHCANQSVWASSPPLLKDAPSESRYELCRQLLEELRRRLCIRTTYLDRLKQEQMKTASYTSLKEPWGLSQDDKLQESNYMFPRSKPQNNSDSYAVFLSPKSRFGRLIKRQATWGADNPHYPAKFEDKHYTELIAGLLSALNGYVLPPQGGPEDAYQLNAECLQWIPIGSDEETGQPKRHDNFFFRTLYDNISSLLDGDSRLMHQLEAHEHTAQVDKDDREQREADFRKAKLPVMFCSPTMELGVDIADLNTVYMRNVPPTPANYAQRSGRAGRSGQPALVLSYCAAKAPHDQYFFADPTRMVAGSVNPPTLDLANEDLVRAHLHAVWLAETGQKLESSINGILDMEKKDELSLLKELADSLSAPGARERALVRGNDILEMLSSELKPEMAPWYHTEWLNRTLNSAYNLFDHSLDRWRDLYRATVRQMDISHAVQTNHAATEKDRKEAGQRYNEARNQHDLLLKANSSVTSDFYTYRYLASQGFLPGYNFPRLPLMAYLPAAREKSNNHSFVSRPRFLALSEFGPMSLIYHEGCQYRVRKVIIGVRDDLATELPTTPARLCPACGYGHFGQQYLDARCNSCDALMEGGRTVMNLYRVENVSARKALRITSDEEERMRFGYETQTTLQFANEGNNFQVIKSIVSEAGEDLIKIHYGPAATVWRINLGWRRRKNKTIFGFNIDPNTGLWCRDDQTPDDVETEDGAVTVSQRITPYVEDRRNVLIVYPPSGLDEKGVATLQYLLKRGIEQEFQLEESELMAEPLPSRDSRHAILFYESAEGGAGVLTRLANDSDAIKRVAARGLEVCHYEAQGQWSPDTMRNINDQCEAGCYRCLLSYFNQPEHALIDRTHAKVIEIACRLTRGEVKRGTGGKAPDQHFDELMRMSNSSLEKAWLTTVLEHRLRLPDKAQWLLDAYNTRPDFIYTDSQVAIYIDGPHHEHDKQKTLDAEITANLRDAGLTVIRFATDQTVWPDVFNRYPDIFGSGDL